MRKCADMKYHFAAELRIYPSSQQKHIIAVNDGASRFVYNRMTANDRELHRLKKTAHLCPAYKGKILSAVFYYPHILRRYTIFKDSPLEICG